MAKLFKSAKLDEIRAKKKLKDAKLAELMDDNKEPIQAVEEQASKLPALRPHTTGDPVRDIVGINHQLNNLPDHFDQCSERQLREAWDGAERVGRAAAWIKGHILLTLNRKYKESAVKKFAEDLGISQVTAYGYIRLAELFPKVDPVLEPTFHFKAIALSHGDKGEALKLIEQAKKKKIADPKYSVRDFIEDVSAKRKDRADHKPVNLARVAGNAISNLRVLARHSDLSEIRENIKELNSLIEKINLALKKAASKE